ncbi:MAG: hypothetical protein AD742_09315 [Methylibium sp. NZG]|nr:MAG: hypothetical protein AD742_09315 [Methylibium sp. NZG]
MITLRPLPLTAAGFAPFGSVIDSTHDNVAGGNVAGAGSSHINHGSSLRHEAVPTLDLQRDGGRAVLAVYAATARVFPFDARLLERHRLSDQVFLPLGGPRRCVLLVAPAALAAPRAEECAAFISDGRQGVHIAAGTWHHGLLALDDGPWAVLERRAGEVDCDEVALDTLLQLALTA